MRCRAVRSRFIPTCVGNISKIRHCRKEITVHPHVCGEHYFVSDLLTRQFGSSPRVWGTCIGRRNLNCSIRFIPTCVGNIRQPADYHYIAAVHPHVCGEHQVRFDIIRNGVGSSPRVWGTSPWPRRCSCDLRFIPTCVGNIGRSNRHQGPLSVHPHVCGEHQ